MRSKPQTLVLLAGLALTAAGRAEVVRAPLMGHIVTGSGSGVAWLTETRILNPTDQTASVSITDVVGIGNPSIRDFTIPPHGILDLRNFELFFATDPPDQFYPSFLALVEFTSSVPIQVLTAVSALEPDPVGPGVPCGYLAYFGGSCSRPVAGPLLHGFEKYAGAADSARLDWITAGNAYHANLFLTNPGSSAIELAAVFRSSSGAIVATRTYSVAPRSMRVVGDALAEPSIRDAVGAGAVTATFTSEGGEFYVLAAVLSDSPACQAQPLYALVQPVIVPR